MKSAAVLPSLHSARLPEDRLPLFSRGRRERDPSWTNVGKKFQLRQTAPVCALSGPCAGSCCQGSGTKTGPLQHRPLPLGSPFHTRSSHGSSRNQRPAQPPHEPEQSPRRPKGYAHSEAQSPQHQRNSHGPAIDRPAHSTQLRPDKVPAALNPSPRKKPRAKPQPCARIGSI